MSYLDQARSDASDTASNFEDEIIESFMESGKASDDLLNDYSDNYHHENHIDKDYDLLEAAELLEELDEYEQTDSGLWEGLKPKDAIICQAAYTYGNAVIALFRDLIEAINNDCNLENLYEQHENMGDTVQDEYDTAETTHNEAEDLKEQESENYERVEFEPPFDVDEETERRQNDLAMEIAKVIREIIANF